MIINFFQQISTQKYTNTNTDFKSLFYLVYSLIEDFQPCPQSEFVIVVGLGTWYLVYFQLDILKLSIISGDFHSTHSPAQNRSNHTANTTNSLQILSHSTTQRLPGSGSVFLGSVSAIVQVKAQKTQLQPDSDSIKYSFKSINLVLNANSNSSKSNRLSVTHHPYHLRRLKSHLENL